MSVHITALEAERFKRLTAVQMKLTPEGLTVIGGGNGQGKTSVLDAITYALGGERYRPSEAKNRDAARPPRIKLTLSNGLIVTRDGKNSALNVTDPKSASSGQRVLDKFVEALALNLPKFMKSTSSEKAQTLLRVVGAGDKLAELTAKESGLVEERRVAGREADRTAKVLEGLAYTADVPDEFISVTELVEQINEAQAMARDKENKERLCDDIASERAGNSSHIDALEEEIEALHGKILAAKQKQVQLTKRQENGEGIISTIVIPDIEPLRESIATAETTNETIRDNRRYNEAKSAARGAAERHDKLDAAVSNVRDDKGDLLAGVKMPLDGLSVVDSELVYNGDLWDCMSGADQLMVSASIVKQINPECGFVLVDKLEQMDVATLGKFGAWAFSENLQIIGTRVSTTAEDCTVIIEDGAIKLPGGDNGQV